MTPFLAKFVSTLNSQEWKNLPETFKNVNELLGEIKERRDLLREELRNHSIKERTEVSNLSKEVSTHFKWHIYSNASADFSIWINEYKSKHLRRSGYAEVPHNHRYWFSSLVLSGGFDNNLYSVSRTPNETSSFDEISISDTVSYTVGDIYTLAVNDVHALANIQDSTLTLLIKSRGLKPYSEEFSLISKKVIKHYTFVSKVKDQYPFINKLK